MSVLFKSDPDRAAAWARFFAEQAPDIDFRVWPDMGDPGKVEYLVTWQVSDELLAALPNLKVFFASGAGIDHIDMSAIPEHVTIVRTVEPGIVDGMIEYVTLSVLAIHRNMFDYLEQNASGEWQALRVIPASARTLGILGLGVLGQAVLDRLGTFGFRLRGWNRSPKNLPGVDCFVGRESLDEFLGGTDILICLLPLTESTRGILDHRVFAALPEGASVINVARGGHLDQAALLEALDSGHLSFAVLDVTDPEPLPSSSPLWRHPRVLVTPHIASVTQPQTAAPVVLENLRRHMGGETLRDVVDRNRGY